MPPNTKTFSPRPDTWLWDMLGADYDIPARWFQCRFGFLATALREGNFRRDAAIVPEQGRRSPLAAVDVAGGRDVRYVIVYARELPKTWKPGVQETLTYRGDVAGTDLVYDVTGEFLQGKARPFRADFRELPLRIYAVLPFQLEQIELQAQQRVRAKYLPQEETNRVSLDLHLQLKDAVGSPVAGRFPISLGLRRSAAEPVDGGYCTADNRGKPSKLVAQVASDGDWALVVRSLLNGEELSLPVKVIAGDGPAASAAVPLTCDGLTIRRAPQPVKLGG